MISYVSVPFLPDTEVTVHYSHGVFQTIVLEDDERRCWPMSGSTRDVLLTDISLVESTPLSEEQRVHDYFELMGIKIPTIRAKIGGVAVPTVERTNYRSATLDAAMRGEGRASVLLESMPSIMARNPNAVVRSRNDGPARTSNRSREGARDRGALLDSDLAYRWTPEDGMTAIHIGNGRIIQHNLTDMPSTLIILADHPQFLIHRA